MSDAITTAAIKKLYGLSAGQCNICGEPVFTEGVHIGQMAHVIAKSPKGPRGDESIANDNTYENLILLCANHHIIVDRDPATYTVEKLLQIKKDYESYIDSVTDKSLITDKKRRADVEFLNAYFKFTPFARVRSLVETLPYSHHLDLLIFEEQFENILKDLPAHYPLNNEMLQNHFQDFIEPCSVIYAILNGKISISDNRVIEVYGGANHNHYCYFNHDEMPLDKVSLIEQELRSHIISLLNAYNSLISYLRKFYPDVDIYKSIV